MFVRNFSTSGSNRYETRQNNNPPARLLQGRIEKLQNRTRKSKVTGWLRNVFNPTKAQPPLRLRRWIVIFCWLSSCSSQCGVCDVPWLQQSVPTWCSCCAGLGCCWYRFDDVVRKAFSCCSVVVVVLTSVSQILILGGPFSAFAILFPATDWCAFKSLCMPTFLSDRWSAPVDRRWKSTSPGP